VPFWVRLSSELAAKALLILSALLLCILAANWLALPLYYSAWFESWVAVPLFMGCLFGLLLLIMIMGWLWKRVGDLFDRVDEAAYRRANSRTNGH
jgi:hypothetical protein